MKNLNPLTRIPIKIGIEGEWLVSEALEMNSEGFQCLLERSLPLQSTVKVVMILTSGPEGKKASQTVDCEGTIQEIKSVSNDKSELLYQVSINLVNLSSSEKRLISKVTEQS